MSSPSTDVPVALVTGGSRGIGAATALALAAAGYRVAVAARTASALDEVCAQIEALGAESLALAVDLSDSEQLGGIVESVAARWGRLDVLVNNAGILPAAAPTQSIGLNEWRRIVDVNVTAPWFLACRARDVMVHTGGGVVVNVTSTAAHYPSIGFTQYNSTKAALAMVTRGCALEWARDGVRVVGVAPGRIETDMVKPILAHDAKHRRPPNPQNRVGRPEEVADLIAYLVSDKASYITGSTVAIDGGELLAVGGAGS